MSRTDVDCYAYDPAGNRTVEQIDDAVTLSAYDHLNRLTSQAPGGPMVIAGTLSEPGTVTISGTPAVVDANHNFRGTVPTTTGTNTFTIVAKDATGNTTTQQYEVDQAGAAKTFAYDANGNLASDGTRTLTWDAANNLTSVTAGSRITSYSYDAQRYRVTEQVADNSVVVSDQRLLWCQRVICEERTSAGATILRAFRDGQETASGNQYFVKDHLSSIRTVLNGSGTALATYSFDPWGRRLLASGTDVTTRGFTGLRVADEGSMAALRAYDADAGRWLGEDPIGVADGLNLYTDVRNNPLSFVDPSGAVRVQSSPTTYSTTSDLDQLTRQCNGGFQWACTRVRMGTGCECYQNSCGSWSPSVTIVSSIEVYIWSKHPRFSVELLRTEEDKHVMTAMSVLDSWIASGEAFEKRTFMSKATCNLNCWAWQKRRKFELVYYSFFPHIATPHPR